MKTFLEYIFEASDSIDAFVRQVYALGTRSRDGVNIKIDNVPVYVELISFSESAHIAEISVPPEEQGSGIGHRVLQKITDLADKHKVTLSLFAKPIDQPHGEQISKIKLILFYKKTRIQVD